MTRRVVVDLDRDEVTVTGADGERMLPLGSPEAFSIISKLYLRCGWDTKYVYGFTWLGRPIIQLPDDIVLLQEVVYAVKPDVVVETGIAHGGSLMFYAGLCRAMGRGRVIGVDVDIRSHNRNAIEAHELFPLITMVEGDSTAPETVARVSSLISQDQRTLVVLDSRHTFSHVLAELRVYSPLVTVGSYIVAMDGIMRDLVGAPRSKPDWARNNPHEAACVFAAERDDFVLEQPPRPFNEGAITERVTYSPGAFLRRIR